MRSRRTRNTVPQKFKGMEAATIGEQLHLMKDKNHRNLSLKDYANIYAAIHHSGVSEQDNYLKSDMVSTVLTQYHVSKGLQIFGERGVDAVLKELRQLHDCMVIEPEFAENMSEKQKSDALQYLMFLKEKRNGTVKGRGCADGREQRVYI